MIGSDEVTNETDGRRARRDRNRLVVLDAVIQMFEEELLVPTIEEASKRSGLSLRSVYRYFPDPDSLVLAASERSLELSLPHALISRLGDGPLDDRIERFVSVRVRLYEHASASYRATLHNAPCNVRLREVLDDVRRRLREQLEEHFAPELAGLPTTAREVLLAAADVATQMDSIDLLRRYRRFTVGETQAVLELTLRSLFGARTLT